MDRSDFQLVAVVFFFFNFIYLFIYLWLCWVFVSVWGLSRVAASGGHSSSQCAGLSLSRPLLLRSTGSRRAGSVIVAHGPSCYTACGIFPDQGLNPCPLHWQADSQPLRHQGSPVAVVLTSLYLHAHPFNEITTFFLSRYEETLMNKTWMNSVGKINTYIYTYIYVYVYISSWSSFDFFPCLWRTDFWS